MKRKTFTEWELTAIARLTERAIEEGRIHKGSGEAIIQKAEAMAEAEAKKRRTADPLAGRI